ncbi:autophagy-type protein 22 [Ramaria rubella]|nr:autophagy-type protein 22 [Ramaria rubella]
MAPMVKGPLKLISEERLHARHIRGWLTYTFACEVFAVVALGMFLPICLEQFAQDHGFMLPEKTTKCSSKRGVSSNAEDERCVVKIGWVWIDTASFSLYVFSISVALQALTVISMGGIADNPMYRKPLLLTFAYLGAFSATFFLLLPSSSPIWPVVGLLACGANVGFGASFVALNSYLPSIARETKEVRQAWQALLNSRQQESEASGAQEMPFTSVDPLSPLTNGPEAYHAAVARSTSKISSFGIAIGYTAGIVVLISTLVPVTLLHSSTFSLRLAIGMSGIWWGVGTIPAGIWLPSGAALKSVEGAEDVRVKETRPWSWSGEIKGAWIRLGSMLRWREIKRLPNTFWYLAAWFLLSDGFSTITSSAILFGKTTLHMPSSKLVLVGILAPLSGIFGSLAWPVVQRRIGWSDLRMIKLLVVLVSLIPLYGCLGFLPIFQREKGAGGVPFGGLTTHGEMYALAVVFGFIHGAFQGYSRSLFSFLIPPGEESRWYGLYSITDKSSSFFGPLIVGLISDRTGNFRNVFFFLTAIMWISLPLLARVDVLQGQEDARQYIAGRGEYVAVSHSDHDDEDAEDV